MRYLALLLLVAVPLAAADVGHGDSPTDTTLYFHHTNEGLAINTQVPTGAVLADAAETPALCDTELAWTGIFTQAPVGDSVTWTNGLARFADISGNLRLTWFVETVQPGSDAPMDLPVQDMRIRAELRAGDSTDAIGTGAVLASGSDTVTPDAVAVPDRFVYKLSTTLSWLDEPGIPADEGFHVQLFVDSGPEQCRVAPLGVRAYSGDGAMSRLDARIYDAVRIDQVTPELRPDGLYITVHASSPWGRFDIASLDTPVLVGPAGQLELGLGEDLSNATHLARDWLLPAEQAVNGTYRVDVKARNLEGTEVTVSELFKLGGDAPPEPVVEATEPVKQESPGIALPLLLGALAALALARRR